MLVISRKRGEIIRIGDDLELIILSVSEGRVKIGFAGPKEIKVRRGEIVGPDGKDLPRESRKPKLKGISDASAKPPA